MRILPEPARHNASWWDHQKRSDYGLHDEHSPKYGLGAIPQHEGIDFEGAAGRVIMCPSAAENDSPVSFKYPQWFGYGDGELALAFDLAGTPEGRRTIHEQALVKKRRTPAQRILDMTQLRQAYAIDFLGNEHRILSPFEYELTVSILDGHGYGTTIVDWELLSNVNLLALHKRIMLERADFSLKVIDPLREFYRNLTGEPTTSSQMVSYLQQTLSFLEGSDLRDPLGKPFGQ